MDNRVESCFLHLLLRWPAEGDGCVPVSPEEVHKIGVSSFRRQLMGPKALRLQITP